MKIDSKELEEYVANVLNAVQSSAKKSPKDFQLNSDVKFELSLVNTKKGDGGINIGVAKAGGNIEKETMTRISFSMGSKSQQERNMRDAKRILGDLFQLEENKSKK